MSGLYIHIPFCKSRCGYCGFYSTTSLEMRQRYVEALCQEIESRTDNDFGTIYFGGGTPSQLTISQLQKIFESVYKYNKVKPDAEITIECNPDDVTSDFVEGLTTLPVNRISMGAQTFNDQLLQMIGRRHSASQVDAAIKRLREAGYRNISIDLMYGFPEESLKAWEEDITKALALHVEHLSAYCLMIEDGTPFKRMQVQPVDEETERQMYEMLMDRLTDAGYEHYEISNFAKPGYRSRHNSSYWNRTPYLGIGAAAHSYDIRSRRWNVANLKTYIEGIETGQLATDREVIDEDTQYNDTVTVALRTCEGINLKLLTEKHCTYCLENAKRYIDSGLLLLEDHHLKLTREGLFVSDMIMRDLIYVD